jgi:hypothetical protein
MLKASPKLPVGYTVEEHPPSTPSSNPWVVLFNGERVGSAPTKSGAAEVAVIHAEMRAKSHPK